SLPIEALVPAIGTALAERQSAVVVAEPGAGKTTVVPWRLLGASWLGERKIVMLEPRRVAARAAAARIAWHLGERVGERVGHRVRFDTRVSARTRLEVVTEGVLTRLLDADPSLEEYGLVIFDEFHERSIHADLGLALTLRAREVFRPELRLLVMSATIDADRVAALLGGAPVISAPGRVFPVETRYRPPRPDQRLDTHVALVIREAVATESGDVLVFLPGVGEINRVADRLAAGNPLGAEVVPLHGTLPAERQDSALAPGRGRRVILATAIAETSLTVPGVRIVIDAGRMRVPRFSPRTGLNRLETVRVTRASADQRRGRAGRTEPGVCFRLWDAAEEHGFLAYRTPEILASDLAPLALDLAAAGVDRPGELAWLDPPPGAGIDQARDLLALLGAVDDQGRITPAGRSMAALALHPRLAHLVRFAQASAADDAAARSLRIATAAALAALLSDRDIARRPSPHEVPDTDIRLRLEALRSGGTPPGFEVDRGGRTRLLDDARQWRRRLDGADRAELDPELSGELLAQAYPDRIGRLRPGQPGRFLLRNGRGAQMPAAHVLAREQWIVAAELDDAGAESRIALAAPLDQDAVAVLVREQGRSRVVTEWDAARASVRAVERTELGAILVAEKPAGPPDAETAYRILLEEIRRGGIARLPWSEAASELRRRLAFLHQADPEGWPDVGDDALLDRLEDWLGPWLTGSLGDLDLAAVLRASLRPGQRGALDRLAPERWEVPTGSRLAIDYADPAAPVLAVRLQEMFGEPRTPAIMDGRLPLTLHLLSPAGRPVQVTRDLAGFWRNSYFDVRKDLKGRYPKHSWPDDPLTAPPTRRAKRRGT
ncbi:MAG: ATP-dependent helicase HrpB, partial [Gemmatimonadales bacterium]